MLICVSISLLLASYSFYEVAMLWWKKSDSLPWKYPTCFAFCYRSGAFIVTFIGVCIFGMLLGLALFAVNITSLADIVKFSELHVPHIVARAECGKYPDIKIAPVRDVITSNKIYTKEILCSMAGQQKEFKHFFDNNTLMNCTSIVFHFLFDHSQKEMKYKIYYCYSMGKICKPAKQTNFTLEYSQDLCAVSTPAFYFSGPQVSGITTETPPPN